MESLILSIIIMLTTLTVLFWFLYKCMLYEHSNNALFIGNSGNNCKSLTHKRQWCCQYFHLLMTQTKTFLTYDTFKMHYNTSGAVIVNNDYFFKKFRRSHLYDRMQCVNDFNKFLLFVKARDDRDLW